MSPTTLSEQALLTLADADKSPLSIRAKALVFIDPRSKALRDRVDQLATQPIPLLIEGETGTGKELLARHIHRASERAGLFVAISCSSLSPQHAQAELFGYSVAAHQGNASGRAGWYGSANNGTLYLDEIGDLSPTLQELLLTALETGEVWRVGANQPTPANVRLLASTSVNLEQAVVAGKFNERLYRYLIDGHLSLPPLRERVGDILPLAEYFLGIYAQRLNVQLPVIGLEAQQRLERHSWPGNTRELENAIHFALLISSGPELLSEHLSLVEQRPTVESISASIDDLINRASASEITALRKLIATQLKQLTEVS